MMQDPKVIIFGYILVLLGVIISAALVFLAARSKNRNDARRDTIADRDGLIVSFQESVNSLRVEVKDLRTEVKEVRDLNNGLTEHNAALLLSNSALVAFGYQTIGVLRENDLGAHIPNPVPVEIHL